MYVHTYMHDSFVFGLSKVSYKQHIYMQDSFVFRLSKFSYNI